MGLHDAVIQQVPRARVGERRAFKLRRVHFVYETAKEQGHNCYSLALGTSQELLQQPEGLCAPKAKQPLRNCAPRNNRWELPVLNLYRTRVMKSKTGVQEQFLSTSCAIFVSCNSSIAF